MERARDGAGVEREALVRGDGSEARGDSGRAAARDGQELRARRVCGLLNPCREEPINGARQNANVKKGKAPCGVSCNWADGKRG